MSDRKKLDIYVVNLDCEAESSAITRGLKSMPGISEVQGSLATDYRFRKITRSVKSQGPPCLSTLDRKGALAPQSAVAMEP